MLHRLLTLPLLAGSLLATSAAGFAQTASPEPAATPAQNAPAPDSGEPHGHRKNRMMAALQELGLSDDQKAKIKNCMTAFRDSRDSATPETRKELRGQIEQILTPDQRTRFAAAMKPNWQPTAATPY